MFIECYPSVVRHSVVKFGAVWFWYIVQSDGEFGVSFPGPKGVEVIT